MPIEMTGMKELLANLDKVGKNVDQAKEKALRAAGEVIRKAAAEKCPRGSTAKSLGKKYSKGQHLADNIVVSPAKSERGHMFVEVGPKRGDNNDFFYGKMLEFGTVKMPAQPFVEPAIREKSGEAMDAMADVIREAISDV